MLHNRKHFRLSHVARVFAVHRAPQQRAVMQRRRDGATLYTIAGCRPRSPLPISGSRRAMA